MKDFITKKGIYIAIAAVVIAIIAAISVALSGGRGDIATMLSQPFFRPIRNAITSMVDGLEQIYNYMYNYDQIEAENQELRERVAELEEEYREYTQMSQEVDRLRELLGFSETREELKFTPVSVISWTASNYSSTFTISRGSNAGIELYDAVMTSAGYLVGQVTGISESSATVTTILDTSMNVGAILYETGETGVACGDFRLFRDGKLRMDYVGDSDSTIIGDTVVTSGESGVFPSDLVIGYVESVGEEVSNLNTYAVITPAADIEHVTEVFVVTEQAVSQEAGQ